MGEPESLEYRKILLAVDGSDCASFAARHALWLAKQLNSDVVAIYVADSHHAFRSGIHAAEARAEMMAEGQTALQDLSEAARALGVSIRTEILEGDPKRLVVDYAAQIGADCLVVGSHGASGVTRALLDSVSTYCVQHSPCPVLVVRPEPYRRR